MKQAGGENLPRQCIAFEMDLRCFKSHRSCGMFKHALDNIFGGSYPPRSRRIRTTRMGIGGRLKRSRGRANWTGWKVVSPQPCW